MNFSARLATVNARLVAFLDDNDRLTDQRSYILLDPNDAQIAIVDAVAFETLYAPTPNPVGTDFARRVRGVVPQVNRSCVAQRAVDQVVQPLPKTGDLVSSKPPRKPRMVKIRKTTSVDPSVKPVGQREAIRLILSNGPGSNEDLRKALRQVYHYDLDSKTFSTLLCQMRNQGQIRKDDDQMNPKWHLAVEPMDL